MAEYNFKELMEAFADLKVFYGEELISAILAVDTSTLRKWTKKTLRPKEKPVLPSENQQRYIAALLDASEILSTLSRLDQKMWWVSFSHYYLYGVPAEEFTRRPNDVRIAALMKASGQEDAELGTT